MLDKIKALAEEISRVEPKSLAELDEIRIKYISKKGIISQLFDDFREVAPELKKEVGKALNELKNLAMDKINTAKE